MGIKAGDEYCYCQLKARGMSVEHYDMTEEQLNKLNEELSKIFGWYNNG
jgi:hypothetical protein